MFKINIYIPEWNVLIRLFKLIIIVTVTVAEIVDKVGGCEREECYC